MTTQSKLSLRGVTRRFGSHVAVADFNLEVRTGEFVCIVGPSGCGKSTVLNLIAGLEQPSEGQIASDGRSITGPGAERGVMFQDYALMPWLTVAGNVGFGLAHGTPGDKLSPAQRAERVREHIELVGLRGAEHKYPHQLSGGMRQRVALARLLANGPDVLLLDEPLGALDAQTRLILQLELLRIWGETRPHAERRTAIFITHDIDEAVLLGDRVVVMGHHPGRVTADIAIDLPRPRTETLRSDPRFGALTARIWQLVRDEAVRAIGGGATSTIS